MSESVDEFAFGHLPVLVFVDGLKETLDVVIVCSSLGS